VVYTKDGAIIVAVLGGKLWHSYCKSINMPELENNEKFRTNELRLQNREEFRAITRPIMKTKTSKEWLVLFHAEGIPCAVVNNIKQACEMEQIKERNMLCKAGEYTLAGNPMKMSGYSDSINKKPVPKVGEHTEKIRREFSI